MMRYFRILKLGDKSDRERALVDTKPPGLDGWHFCASRGEPMAEHYPDDGHVVLSEKYGLRLTDFISNTLNYIIASTRMKEVIEAHSNVPIEYLPLSLFNPRKRLQSSEYWIVNPIGDVDCVDLEKSDVRRGHDTGLITFIMEYQFLEERLRDTRPSMVRPKETPWEVFVDEPTAQALHAIKATNVRVQMVPCN
jgi:hypothetical protein